MLCLCLQAVFANKGRTGRQLNGLEIWIVNVIVHENF